jgi:hypothetical protein
LTAHHRGLAEALYRPPPGCGFVAQLE